MSSELPPLPSPAWRPAVSRAVHRRGPAPPWRQQTVVPLRPTRRFNRRRQAVIAGLGFVVCLGLFCWASFWLWPPSGACIILLGAGYEDNLAIPHNAYGRRSLNDLLEVSSSPNTAFFWGSRQLRLKHEPRELHVGDDWNAGWTDFPEKTLVVYLACHGAVDDQGAYLLPQDAGTRPEDRLRLTAILDRLAALPADKNKVLILDATQVTAHGPLGLLHNDFARELDRLDDRITAMPNLVVLSASDAEQRSWGCPVVPMADARLRMRLLTNLARISRRLLIETDQESRDAVGKRGSIYIRCPTGSSAVIRRRRPAASLSGRTTISCNGRRR